MGLEKKLNTPDVRLTWGTLGSVDLANFGGLGDCRECAALASSRCVTVHVAGGYGRYTAPASYKVVRIHCRKGVYSLSKSSVDTGVKFR